MAAVQAKIAVLPGDGIGEEIMQQALRVLTHCAERYGHNFSYQPAYIGGVAYDRYKNHFPDETKKICESSDAILFGSVGGPVHEQHLEKWKNCESLSLLSIRKTFGFNINLRPCRVYPALSKLCPLKDEIVARGIDILIVRELLGDLYFGAHEQGVIEGKRVARDIAEYDEVQISSVAHYAFKAARLRKKRVTSIDKANVLHVGKLWRAVVSEVAANYPDVTLEHMLVDNCAMQLIKNPSSFDVLLTPNMFGDILSDEAAVFPGSLGLTPSASINPNGFGFYEPSGGSAPDIAGKGIANPTAQILSVALMLRLSFDLNKEATIIEQAVDKALTDGLRTSDIATGSEKALSCEQFTNGIIARIS